MPRARISPLSFAALLALMWMTSAVAQNLAPQPFAAPPRLLEKGQAEILALPAVTGCRPDGDITQVGNLVTLRLVAKMAPNKMRDPGTPNGMDTVQLRSYGGCLTGPVIEAKPGSTVRILLTNALDANDPTCPPPPGWQFPGVECFNTINMHYHGLHVSPSGNSDNVLLNIAPQTKFEYEVNIPFDHPSGTFWYHPHRHGSTATQVASGQSGALIIRGDRHYTGGATGDVDTILHDADGKPMPEKIFLFQQIPYACFNADGSINQNSDGTWKCDPGQTGIVQDFGQQLDSPTIWDTSGRFTSINGQVQPAISVPAGEIQRWRMIHAGIHDTVNVQIVPMVTTGALAALAAPALGGVLAGSAKAQVQTVQQLCPSGGPGGPPVALVPQFEIAADGLTRTKITPIGLKETSESGGIGTNFLQPGYRSDVLVVFPREGTYCILNQAATSAERPQPGGGGGGQGPSGTQLLATVTVTAGKPVGDDPFKYIRNALADANANDKPALPQAALDGLRDRGDLTPWRGMPEIGPVSTSGTLRKAAFFIGNDNQGNFGFFVNLKAYDPDRIDKEFTMQVNTTEDWVLTSKGEPHIYHIHVNPFEIMDVKFQGNSIFSPDGKCLVPPDSKGLQNQYCNMWHVFKDTVFVQNDYEVHMRTTYDRYIGEYVLHCHILDHEDSGMMANVLIVPDITAPNGGLGMPSMMSMSNGTMTQQHMMHK